jgi:putative membrane protein
VRKGTERPCKTLSSRPRAHSRSSPNARLLLVDPHRWAFRFLGQAARNKNKWKSTSHWSLSASLSGWPWALAFGRPCRVIAERVYADEEDIQKYEFQKVGAPGNCGVTLRAVVMCLKNDDRGGVPVQVSQRLPGTFASPRTFLSMANPRIVETNEKLKDSAVQIKDSATQLERSTARVEDSADRRTELAADRTIFAAERTYAAWVRTGLFAMASGIGAKALMSDVLPVWLIILMLFSVFCFGAAVWRHLYPGLPPPVPDAARIHPALLILMNAFLSVVSITSLIGIWFATTPD